MRAIDIEGGGTQARTMSSCDSAASWRGNVTEPNEAMCRHAYAGSILCPHMRGPADAGMDPEQAPNQRRRSRLPRARGDEKRPTKRRSTEGYSPNPGREQN